jgi:hypothetical protein
MKKRLLMEDTNEPIITKKSKSWKKYAFEFFMLFLAVFMGFVAENMREDFVEKQQAKELAKSFYEELRNDSITAAQKIVARLKKEQSLTYMIDFFRDSTLTSHSKQLSINFLYGIAARTPAIFTPRTVILDQLRSSGSLRYLKNNQLQKLVGDLSVAIDYIQVRQSYENEIFYRHVEPIMINHMDFSFQSKIFSGNTIFESLEQYENNNDYIFFQLSHIDKINRNELINTLSYYQYNGLKSTRLIPFKSYIEANAALLKELRKEYALR